MKHPFVFISVLLCGFSSMAHAHPLAPALLELQETAPARFDVLWRTSATRVQTVDVTPVLPADCQETKAMQASVAENESLTARWSVRCDAGLVGKTLRIAGLERGHINVILRVKLLQGDVIKTLLGPDQTTFIVPAPEAVRSVFSSYLQLGVEHLLTGFDHLLFVLGLLLLVPDLRRLIFTVTAFTVGHSITLTLASLNLLNIPQAIAEFGIAATILLLACELTNKQSAQSSWIRRRPWLMAASFGLIHGLGFAGALREIGLPQDEIPLSLFAFNLGIEAGQLLLVFCFLLLTGLWRRRPVQVPQQWTKLAPLAPAYLIGTLAAYWCIERASVLLF
jgi:hydrogenase/urease accessory protein HupE